MLRYLNCVVLVLMGLGFGPAMADARYEGGYVVRYASGACRIQGLQVGSFGRVTLRPKTGDVADTTADFFQDQVAWSVKVAGGPLFGSGAYQAALIGARAQSASELMGAFTVTGDVIHEGRQFVRLHGDFTNFLGIPGCRVLARFALSRITFGHKFLPPRPEFPQIHSSLRTRIWRGQMTITRVNEYCSDYTTGMTFTAFLVPKNPASFTEGYSYLMLHDGLRIWSLSAESSPNFTFIHEGRVSIAAQQGLRFPDVSRGSPYRDFFMFPRDVTFASTPHASIYLRGVIGSMFYARQEDCEVEIEGAFTLSP